MKNLKKVLAMVLAFACTFTMFASAKVYEDVQPGSEFSEAITMLSDLGVIQGKTDNKYHPEDTITRAEACALIARLMTGDPNAAGFNGAHHFKDVPAGHWASSAIGYAVVNGIAVGVDQAGTKFEPNRPIKDKEFVTMIVRALGYETPDMRNNFPFGYMSAARAIGVLQDVNMVPDTDALRGEDAQVIYNAMFVDYARGAKRVNVAHGTSVESYPTLAESVWNLDRAALGTWTGKDDEEATLTNCKSHTWVIVGADKKEEGRILAYPIKDESTDVFESDKESKNGTKYVPYSFKYEGDVDSLKGYQVELWGAGKHGEPVWEKGDGKFVYSDNWNIKAIKTVKNQKKYDYDASKADSKSDNGTIELGEETKLDLKSVADNADKITSKNTTKTNLTTYLSKEKYNGESATKDKSVEKALNVRDGAQYRLMDWDSDGDVDWVVVDEANYFKVESANSKRVTVTSMKPGDEEKETTSETQTWKIGDLNDEKDYKIKYEVPEGLKEGDIIELTYKTAYDKSEKCEVITATAKVVEAENHELDKVATKDNLVLTFDGETKQLAQANDKGDTIVPENPSKYIDFDEEELGAQFALTMNRNGFIIHSDYATESSNYMMVLDTENGNDGVRGELGAMNILTSDNKVEKGVEVVSDLRIDGDSKNNGYNKDGRKFTETKVVGKVFKYWKDADGKITKMESAIELGKNKDGITANSYEYAAKNDRLTLDGKSYALKDAKVIFAVKPYTDNQSYIQSKGGYNASTNDVNLFVKEDDVLAVKQADIPDIGTSEDTKNHALDMRQATSHSWVGDPDIHVAIDADKNKDINAAILGVNNFNKFNAGSTKVGLVMDVSYDKNDVVSIEVATNGKVETISSAEKTDFDDVVSVLDYVNKDNTKSYSVGSRNETINNGIMQGSNLKDYLNKNAAYAEITTDADGKLTEVLFMDKKDGTDTDGAVGGVNENNVVAGNYYQVSRKVIADVAEGKWMSVIKGSAMYANKDNFKTMDTKDEQKAADFTSDVAYYVIDGKPTKHDDVSYDNTKASILDGFDGNPKVKVGEASDVKASDIRNNATSADDLYNVADVASKIDDNGAGDIVAVYAYDDEMGEKIGIASGSSMAVQGNVVVGQENVTVNVTLPSDDNLDSTKVYVDVVNKDGKAVLSNVPVQNGKVVLNTKDLEAGTYTMKLYGYNKVDKGYDLLASETLTVNAAETYAVTKIEFAEDAAGTTSSNPVLVAGTKNTFYVKLEADKAVAGLTEKDMEVHVANELNPRAFVAKKVNDNVKAVNTVFEIRVDGEIKDNDKVEVVLKTGATLTEVPKTPATGNAQTSTSKPQAQVDTVKPMIDATVEGADSSVVTSDGVYFALYNGSEAVSDVQNITFKDSKGFAVAGTSVAAGSNGVYRASGLKAETYTVVVDGVEVGTLKVVAATSVKLADAEKTINILDTAAETTVTLEGAAKDAAIVVSKSAITNGTETTQDTIDGVTVKAEGNKLVVSGTPTTNASDRAFHVGIKGTTTEATFTVKVKKLTKTDITSEFVFAGEAGNKNKMLNATLSYNGNQLTAEQLKMILGTTAGQYTVTATGNPTVTNVNLDSNPIVLTLNNAPTDKATAITLKSKDDKFVADLDYTGLSVELLP